MDVVLRHELAAKYDGKISDEGDSGKSKGYPEKYNTYCKWVEIKLAYVEEGDLKEDLRNLEWMSFPQSMLSLKDRWP